MLDNEQIDNWSETKQTQLKQINDLGLEAMRRFLKNGRISDLEQALTLKSKGDNIAYTR